MRCSYCQQTICRNLTMQELLWPFALKTTELCDRCRQSFEPITGECCPTCCKKSAGICPDCLTWRHQYPAYDFCHQALFYYNEAFQTWLYRYKFLGDRRLAATFRQEIRDCLRKTDFLIVPLPLAPERMQSRGFNQVTAFLQASDIPYQSFLVRQKNDPPQATKKRLERLQLTQPYTLAVEPAQIKGQKILLADDVYTTGRTLFHAAEVINACQPKMVKTFSLAR